MWVPVLPLLLLPLLLLPALLLPARASAGGAGRASCRVGGQLHPEGAAVDASDPCLQCRCVRGALSCRRRDCAALPGQPPRCGDPCCPELQCPDAAADARRAGLSAEDVYPAEVKPHLRVHPACVSGGAAYAAGSAMAARVPCERCFCLGGARRCVRPRCLPAPPGCRAAAAPGACCPPAYTCQHHRDEPHHHESHLHDCNVNGRWVTEGERVASSDGGDACTLCFCLRGEVRCQSLACAPPLVGCEPVLEPGQCCPHRYRCAHHDQRGYPGLDWISDNALTSMRNQDRSLRAASAITTTTTIRATRADTTPPLPLDNSITVLGNGVTENSSHTAKIDERESSATTKVKRGSGGAPPPPTPAPAPPPPSTATVTTGRRTFKAAATTDGATTDATDGQRDATERPESSVKIVVNGTVNCTAELSSTTFAVSSGVPWAGAQPAQSAQQHAHAHEPPAYNPTDIITDRTRVGDFDDDESYAVNVTSSLIGAPGANRTAPAAAHDAHIAHDAHVAHSALAAAPTGEGFVHTYSKPTLPPSLPNLKIIPFVAADAVFDDEVPSKQAPPYPASEDEDKYPVYYPSGEAEPVLPLRRHNAHAAHAAHTDRDADTALLTPAAPAAPAATPPALHLFSPPLETEGGFIPRAPGAVDDYYAPYPSTAAGTPAPAPHLTTSMRLDAAAECLTEDGSRLLEGETIGVACSTCICAWGELHCSRRACPGPAEGCAPGPDGCCADVLCDLVESPPTSPTGPVRVSPRATEAPAAASNNSGTELNMFISTATKSYVTATSATSATKINNNQFRGADDGASEAVTFHTEKLAIQTDTSLHDKQTTADERTDRNGSGSSSGTGTGTGAPEYEDEDDDEEFSFGSVLKLLLSENYETTTAAPTKHSLSPSPRPAAPAAATTTTTTTTTTTHIPTDKLQPATSAGAPYTAPHSTVSRIEQLVLGGGGGGGAGLPKLSGCNIYGRTYRVGGSIAELTTPCRECRCTGLGVQCAQREQHGQHGC